MSAIAQSPTEQLMGLAEVRTKYGLRGAGQTVAVIDTGLAYDHAALGGGFGEGARVVGGWDFAEDDSDPYDDGPGGGHGTHVAGIVGAVDGELVTGVAPSADLVALRTFNDDGAGSFEWIESALNWVHNNRDAFENPITTVNLSLAAQWNSNQPPSWDVLEGEFSQLKTDGLFLSAAAGNDFTSVYNEPGLAYPAASPNVIAAMSVDDNGALSYFTQRSQSAIGAPGRNISSTAPDYLGNNNGTSDDDYRELSGTNMAAPYLAGAGVLIREAMELFGNTGVTQQDIYDVMMSTADPIYDPATDQYYSRLNLLAAIDSLAPVDDYGSTAEAAEPLGDIDSSGQISGLIAQADDSDYFEFTAGSSGMASLTTTPTNYLQPNWTVWNEQGDVIVDQGDVAVSFPVITGEKYLLAVSSSDGIGYFDTQLDVGPDDGGGGGDDEVEGDFNSDGVVDAADYALWRDGLGTTFTMEDYSLWQDNFGASAPGGALSDDGQAVPEPGGAFTLLLAGVMLGRAAAGRPQRRKHSRTNSCGNTQAS